MQGKRSSGNTLLVAAGAIVVVGAIAALSASSGGSVRAESIVEKCAHTAYKPVCYESEVPMLYPTLSVPEIFDVVRRVRQLDPSFQFCHVLAHKVGQRVVAEDPEKWLEAIPLNPSDGLCSNGFIHGVIGGRFRSDVLDSATIEKLVSDFSRACERRENWQPSDLDRAICYHGMGHVFTFITDADIPRALSLCARTVPLDHQRMCIEGVFMQIYQPLEPDDYALIARMPLKPSTTTVRQYCGRFEDPSFEGACLRESWPFFRKGILDGTGVEEFCSGQPNTQETDNCYQTATALIGRMHLDEPKKAIAACKKIPAARQSDCFAVIAQAVLEEDRANLTRAVQLCNVAPVSEYCIRSLIARSRFIFGTSSPELMRFCGILGERFRKECLEEYRQLRLL